MNKGIRYLFAVDAFNESGVSRASKIVVSDDKNKFLGSAELFEKNPIWFFRL
jgi:hypothetical protein